MLGESDGITVRSHDPGHGIVGPYDVVDRDDELVSWIGHAGWMDGLVLEMVLGSEMEEIEVGSMIMSVGWNRECEVSLKQNEKHSLKRVKTRVVGSAICLLKIRIS